MLLSGVLCNKIYNYLDEHSLLAEEQKGCRKRFQGYTEQLILDTVVTQYAVRHKKDQSICHLHRLPKVF